MQQQMESESSGHKRVVALAVDSSAHSENALDCKFLVILFFFKVYVTVAVSRFFIGCQCYNTNDFTTR